MAYLDEYEYLKKLGTGAFATVFKGRHIELGYIRAIRELHGSIENEQDPVYKNFLEECKILLRLGNGVHPNIVHIYRPRLLRNRALVEMDFIDGHDIDSFMKEKKGFLPLEEVLRFVREMSSALAYCHEDIYEFCVDHNKEYKYELESELKGQTFTIEPDPNDGSKDLLTDLQRRELIRQYKVIHNDLHSKNIMRKSYDGSYILLDFGLAIQDGTVVKSSKRNGGAPEYKAPEKWDNDTLISEQSDIYSFGVLMYEMLAGRVPFVYDSTLSQLPAEHKLSQQHKADFPPAIEPLRRAAFELTHPGAIYVKDYPDWLEEVIMKCLEKKPEDRYTNGKQLFEAIKKEFNQLDARVQVLHPEAVGLGQLSQSDPSLVDKNIPPHSDAQKPIENVGLEKGKSPWSALLIAALSLALVFLLLFLGILFVKSKRAKNTSYSVPSHQVAAAELEPEVTDTVPADSAVDVSNFTEAANGVDFEMVGAKGGTFKMGSNDGESNEKPVHKVTLSSFYMARTEVTQALWKAVMGTSVSDQRDKEDPSLPLKGEGDDYPMYYVSWEEVRDFISQLNSITGKSYRLPTEAEWEYAARGGNMSQGYEYSGGNSAGDVAWYDANSEDTSHPVASRQPNELGLCDMTGNVWEWCADRYGRYKDSHQTDPSGSSYGSHRVARGGGWNFSLPFCRVTYRDKVPPEKRNASLGFRLVLSS